jgi:hypothetical protein
VRGWLKIRKRFFLLLAENDDDDVEGMKIKAKL